MHKLVYSCELLNSKRKSGELPNSVRNFLVFMNDFSKALLNNLRSHTHTHTHTHTQRIHAESMKITRLNITQPTPRETWKKLVGSRQPASVLNVTLFWSRARYMQVLGLTSNQIRDDIPIHKRRTKGLCPSVIQGPWTFYCETGSNWMDFKGKAETKNGAGLKTWKSVENIFVCGLRLFLLTVFNLSLIHIWRCRRDPQCRSRWSPYH